MQRASQEEWAKRAQRWKDSGLSAREFAAETGLNAKTLSWWASRLRREGGTAGQHVARGARAPKFVEVTAAAMSTDAAPIELLLDGVLIRVRGDFEPETLQRVLSVVRQR